MVSVHLPRRVKEITMILEVAVLNVRADQSDAFERTFAQAQDIISSMPGYISHQLQRCIEVSGRYILLVNWRTLEDHTVGFRESSQYQQWKTLLHHFYDPIPTVEHYKPVFSRSALQAIQLDRSEDAGLG
jgi:heme-degrading monooxygenase HmoA